MSTTADFTALSAFPAHDEHQISKDVYRTEVARDITPNQRKLYLSTIQKILRAYSNLCPQIGYIQGMNVIVSATLFSICDDFEHISSYGEFAFRLVVALLEDLHISDYYKNDMKRMLAFFTRIEDKVKVEFPGIYQRLVSIEVS